MNTTLAQLLRDKVARNVGAIVTQPVQPAGSAVSERIVRKGWQVEHCLSGPSGAVLDRAEAICRDYPPEGYGTRIAWSRTHMGQTEAVVSRSDSCD